MDDIFPAFSIDDYDEVYEQYFKDISVWEALDSDISYWYNITSKAIDLLNIKNGTQHYKSDYSKGLAKEKAKIIQGIQQWEQYDIELDECTLCTSATIASLITLSALKKMGVQQIVFETPCYFASVLQAQLLGFNVILIPTYFVEAYRLKIEKELINNNLVKAIWVSQPRFALGTNQEQELIRDIYTKISDESFLVVDEANEHQFPSHLCQIQPRIMRNIIRFRSLFKPLGLNGPRISFILHNKEYRTFFEDAMDIVQGGIDYNSIAMAIELYSQPSKLHLTLNAVHQQIMNLKHKAELVTQGSRLELSPLVNGYLGSLHIHFDKGLTYEQNRKKLLQYCQKTKMPVILGSSMYFATEADMEHIRLNYFMHESLFLNGIQALSDFYRL